MKKIDVAVAIIFNKLGHILIAKRPDHAHQGGKWEFPGGKIEKGESIEEALTRELAEEVGITVQQTSPFMALDYDYGDKLVSLNIWKVTQFVGDATGVEQQQIRWVSNEELVDFTFPEANKPIIDKLLNIKIDNI